MEAAQRILIVNVNWLGDVLFSTPFIRAVREAYPRGFIACLLHPRCREVLEGNPRLDEIILYDEELAHRSLAGKAALVWRLKARRFDTAFLLHRSFTKAFIVFLSGAKRRIGYATKGRRALLTDVVEDPAEEAHKVEYFLNVARAAGIPVTDTSYEFFVTPADTARAGELLRAGGIGDDDTVVAINPGGNWGPKRWPKEHYAALADRLIAEAGARIVITGAEKDIALAGEIRAAMKGAPVVTCGKTTLKELGAVFARAQLVVANDTGPMHVAVAMGSRVIALFGPTAPRLTGPYGRGDYTVISRNRECDVPCYDVTCTDNRCMRAVGVETVLREALGALRAARARKAA